MVLKSVSKDEFYKLVMGERRNIHPHIVGGLIKCLECRTVGYPTDWEFLDSFKHEIWGKSICHEYFIAESH